MVFTRRVYVPPGDVVGAVDACVVAPGRSLTRTDFRLRGAGGALASSQGEGGTSTASRYGPSRRASAIPSRFCTIAFMLKWTWPVAPGVSCVTHTWFSTSYMGQGVGLSWILLVNSPGQMCRPFVFSDIHQCSSGSYGWAGALSFQYSCGVQ